MRIMFAAFVALLAMGGAAAADTDPAVSAAFEGWSLPVPSAGGLVFCHGYNCNFRTEVGCRAPTAPGSPA